MFAFLYFRLPLFSLSATALEDDHLEYCRDREQTCLSVLKIYICKSLSL